MHDLKGTFLHHKLIGSLHLSELSNWQTLSEPLIQRSPSDIILVHLLLLFGLRHVN
jgi:hypothetical protein